MILPLIAVPVTVFVLWALMRPAKALPRSVAMSIPAYAHEGKWPKSTGLDAGLRGHSLETVKRALETTTNVAALQEAASLMREHDYPIAAERLEKKAAIISRLIDEDHWMAQGWQQ